jgi:hypothetical protein
MWQAFIARDEDARDSCVPCILYFISPSLGLWKETQTWPDRYDMQHGRSIIASSSTSTSLRRVLGPFLVSSTA